MNPLHTCSVCKSKICRCVWGDAVKERSDLDKELKNIWPRFVQELTDSENQYDSLRQQRYKKQKVKDPNLLPLPSAFMISKVNFNKKSQDVESAILST